MPESASDISYEKNLENYINIVWPTYSITSFNISILKYSKDQSN